MSWSTSSRERAKLGRLDSEPPLLLREWPPETGRERQGDGGRGGGGGTETRGQTEGERGSRRAGGHNEQGQRQEEGRVRQREEGGTGRRIDPFNSLNTSLKERFTEKFNLVIDVSLPGQ